MVKPSDIQSSLKFILVQKKNSNAKLTTLDRFELSRLLPSVCWTVFQMDQFKRFIRIGKFSNSRHTNTNPADLFQNLWAFFFSNGKRLEYVRKFESENVIDHRVRGVVGVVLCMCTVYACLPIKHATTFYIFIASFHLCHSFRFTTVPLCLSLSHFFGAFMADFAFISHL